MIRKILPISFFLAITAAVYNRPESSLNIYGWYGIIPKKVFKDFENEYKIKIIYDVYDNNDSLEAKLLATNSGYDVVFPSLIPYGSKQTAMGIYSELDPKLIPNIKNINGEVTNKFQENGGNTNYLIPIFWGTVGIAIEENIIKKEFPDENIDSYDFLFDPEKISKIHKYGVSFPEEYIDIFPQAKVFLGLDHTKRNIDDITKLKTHFYKIRKYITKFSSNTMINDLLYGTVCVAIGSSDNAWRTMRSAETVGKKIKYILPKNTGVLWIDCVGIPDKARNKDNAYKFINYLLRPEIAAQITNYSGILVNIPKATKLFNDEIKSDKQIFPADKEIINNLIMGQPTTNSNDISYDKIATRAWSKVRMNQFNN